MSTTTIELTKESDRYEHIPINAKLTIKKERADKVTIMAQAVNNFFTFTVKSVNGEPIILKAEEFSKQYAKQAIDL